MADSPALHLAALLLPFALAGFPGCSGTDPAGDTDGKAPVNEATTDVGRPVREVRFRQPLPPRRVENAAPHRDAILDGLRWLARHQSPDGRWSSDGFGAACGKAGLQETCGGAGAARYDVGVTGLALLSFLGAGFAPIHSGRDTHYDGICFGDVVKKGLQWLVSQQSADGCIGGKETSNYMINHAIAALALCEAYGLISSDKRKEPAARAIGFIVQAQNPGAGWRYTARCGDNDSFVTSWCVMALKSAQIASLDFPPAAFDGAKAWIDHVTDADGRAGYDKPGSTLVVLPERSEQFANHDTMTAIALLCRIFIDKHRRDPWNAKYADLLAADLPSQEAFRIDYCYWYFGTLARFQIDGPWGPRWKAWKEKLWPILGQTQQPPESGCRRGSWDPADRWGAVGGRVYATAIACLPLECYYAYDNVFRESGDPPKK